MRSIFMLIFTVFCNAQQLKISDFTSDLYSKSGGLKQISLELKIIGDDVINQNDYILDSINTIISSYFYEDLFTEVGKENLKKTLIKYAGKKHSINIDEVLIIKLKSTDNAEKLKEILKEANLL